MTQLRLLLVLLLAVAQAAAMAQESPWQRWMEQVATPEDDLDEAAWQELGETLEALEENPIDLNRATREELEQLPFLDESQVEELCTYLYRYGTMKSLAELSLLESFDNETRLLLSQVACCGTATEGRDESLLSRLRHARHSITLTGRVPFYRREGDRNGYLGYPYRHALRYELASGNRLRAGLVGTQDAGEPFFADRNRLGYDHYTPYFFASQLSRRVKALALGHYRLRFGLGLVLNNDLSYGKAASLNQLSHTSTQLKPHASSSASNYLQGAAVTLAPQRHTQLTLFGSWRPVDGTPVNGSPDNAIASINSGGYHRSSIEMGRKNNTGQWATGLHAGLRRRWFHLGVSAVATGLSRPLQPDTAQRYRRHYPKGRRFANLSADYGFKAGPLTLNGETATGDKGSVATLNTATLRIGAATSLNLTQRFYGYRYNALLARSLSEGGRVQNESGLLVALATQPLSGLHLTAYADYARFAWPRYQADSTSHAFDSRVTAQYTHARLTLAARYRLHLRERNNADETALSWQTRHQLTLETALRTGVWTLSWQVQWCRQEFTDRSDGWLLGAKALAAPAPGWQVEGGACWFRTDDGDSRLYRYERGPRYAFSLPSFAGHGTRLTVFSRTRLTTRLTATARMGLTRYFARSTTGTGLQAVNARTLTDLNVQLNFKI